jgi:hypothetical protein
MSNIVNHVSDWVRSNWSIAAPFLLLLAIVLVQI